MSDEEPRCDRCNGPKPPGGDLCPVCEDLQAIRIAPSEPPARARPPHGNTTR